jgi:hypothetical protein
MRCLGCGYDLRGLPENRCPECGRPFAPNDPRTYTPVGLPSDAFAQAAILGALLTVPGVGLLALKAIVGGPPRWLCALGFFFGLAGVSISIVMAGASGRRLLRHNRQLPEDQAALRRAFYVSAAVLVATAITLWLVTRAPR